MTTASAKKRPASAATDPGFYPPHPWKGITMNAQTDTIRTIEAASGSDIGEAVDLLTRAMAVNQLVFMAGESIATNEVSEAITTGSDVIRDLLDKSRALLCAAIKSGRA